MHLHKASTLGSDREIRASLWLKSHWHSILEERSIDPKNLILVCFSDDRASPHSFGHRFFKTAPEGWSSLRENLSQTLNKRVEPCLPWRLLGHDPHRQRQICDGRARNGLEAFRTHHGAQPRAAVDTVVVAHRGCTSNQILTCTAYGCDFRLLVGFGAYRLSRFTDGEVPWIDRGAHKARRPLQTPTDIWIWLFQFNPLFTGERVDGDRLHGRTGTR